jgi:6-pyruvoyl-tetrahydropterin synthase
MGHRLPSYDGICASPHGHNIVVTAGVYNQGPFLDFKILSDDLQKILKDFDHAMVLFASDPLVAVLKEFNFRVVTLSQEPTTENIAAYIYTALHAANYSPSSVRVQETAKYAAVCSSFPNVEVLRCV